MKPKHEPDPPMTLGNMCELGVQHLIASCLNQHVPAHRLIDVSGYSEVIGAQSRRQTRGPMRGDD